MNTEYFSCLLSGLIVQPKKAYATTISGSLHITHAVLDVQPETAECAKLLLTYEYKEYILCVLEKSRRLQIPLNLKFAKGDEISIRSVGMLETK